MNNYKNMILECDKTLDMLRKEWFKAEGKDKEKWSLCIDSFLNERLRLMKLRNGECQT